MTDASIPTIETARLRLRPLTLADKPVYAEMRADPEVVRFLSGGEALIPFAEEIAESRLRTFAEDYRHGFGVWAVEEKATGRFVGQAGLRKVDRNEDVEVLYAFVRDAWGKGYAREAARASLEFGFETAALPRIVAFVIPENRASARVLEAVGMRPIGEMTYNDFPVLGYALAAADWRRSESEKRIEAAPPETSTNAVSSGTAR